MCCLYISLIHYKRAHFYVPVIHIMVMIEESAFLRFGPKMKITSGIRSGPLSIFDRVKTANTLILSPASTFMSANLWQQTTSTGSNLYWGIMGGVSDMVPEFETSTILFYSNQGINKVSYV